MAGLGRELCSTEVMQRRKGQVLGIAVLLGLSLK